MIKCVTNVSCCKVVSRGEIVTSGHVAIDENHAGDKSHQIPAIQSMVPSARLVAYYMHNGKVISNSIWFDIEDVCDGQVYAFFYFITKGLQP